jgi:hypothetical protein
VRCPTQRKERRTRDGRGWSTVAARGA